MPGRLTIGLWNSYDPRRFQEAHRRAVARAAAVALGFETALATFGMPFDDLAQHGRVAERRGKQAAARRGEVESEPGEPLDTPLAIARKVAATTSIGGEENDALVALSETGRFHPFAYSEGGFPPQLGFPILTTSIVGAGRAATAEAIASRLASNESVLLVFGLGPHGVAKNVRALCREEFDVTGRGQSLETATALGAVVAAVATASRFRLPRGR